ncbi:hypothetical protein Pelo_3815 [Pelomyxa schiedti]|nr:hypothetical protein Pelo_3815 [Pelomyxa schiedti]
MLEEQANRELITATFGPTPAQLRVEEEENVRREMISFQSQYSLKKKTAAQQAELHDGKQADNFSIFRAHLNVARTELALMEKHSIEQLLIQDSAPGVIQAVILAALILLRLCNDTDTNWIECQKILKRSSLVECIMQYDPFTGDPNNGNWVEQQIQCLNPEEALQASPFIYILLEWVTLCLKLHQLLASSKPSGPMKGEEISGVTTTKAHNAKGSSAMPNTPTAKGNTNTTSPRGTLIVSKPSTPKSVRELSSPKPSNAKAESQNTTKDSPQNRKNPDAPITVPESPHTKPGTPKPPSSPLPTPKHTKPSTPKPSKVEEISTSTREAASQSPPPKVVEQDASTKKPATPNLSSPKVTATRLQENPTPTTPKSHLAPIPGSVTSTAHTSPSSQEGTQLKISPKPPSPRGTSRPASSSSLCGEIRLPKSHSKSHIQDVQSPKTSTSIPVAQKTAAVVFTIDAPLSNPVNTALPSPKMAPPISPKQSSVSATTPHTPHAKQPSISSDSHKATTPTPLEFKPEINSAAQLPKSASHTSIQLLSSSRNRPNKPPTSTPRDATATATVTTTTTSTSTTTATATATTIITCDTKPATPKPASSANQNSVHNPNPTSTALHSSQPSGKVAVSRSPVNTTPTNNQTNDTNHEAPGREPQAKKEPTGHPKEQATAPVGDVTTKTKTNLNAKDNVTEEDEDDEEEEEEEEEGDDEDDDEEEDEEEGQVDIVEDETAPEPAPKTEQQQKDESAF